MLAVALQAIGVPARSWLGSQVAIHTDAAHAKARIRSIDSAGLEAGWSRGEVAVIPGFQGIANDGSNRVTTLGRGGSDTSAVAVAAAVKADRCDIYTDVDGVYTDKETVNVNERVVDDVKDERKNIKVVKGVQMSVTVVDAKHKERKGVVKERNKGENEMNIKVNNSKKEVQKIRKGVKNNTEKDVRREGFSKGGNTRDEVIRFTKDSGNNEVYV
nr:colicin-like bacteriocin tRNase domain-containing protein [Escherichia coli]